MILLVYNTMVHDVSGSSTRFGVSFIRGNSSIAETTIQQCIKKRICNHSDKTLKRMNSPWTSKTTNRKPSLLIYARISKKEDVHSIFKKKEIPHV